MSELFRAYKIPKTTIPAYLIESTAPNNVDDPTPAQPKPLPGLESLKADAAIEEIVDRLHGAAHPSLAITIHGFNNPQEVVLRYYRQAFETINRDPAIGARSGLVCIGYRWPSESIGAPFWTAFQAAPWFLVGLLGIGLLFVFLPLGLPWLKVIGMLLAAVSITALILRIAVYFRDGYRATAYGVPDLVEVIRLVDLKLSERADREAGESGERENRVGLSFIGHSMGALVVTSVVRILSDVFSPPAIRRSLNAGVRAITRLEGETNAKLTRLESKIGKAFHLQRLVLVSPDISAEALISNRANFLASSLGRFREAYLFSNEADEVLRQISTLANYFSFPTRSRNHGYRLGNVGVRADGYGIIERGKEWDLSNLRIIDRTFREIYEDLAKQDGQEQIQQDLPRYFSYFDCTDCVDDSQGVLTLAQPGMPNKMGPLDHVRLLFRYLFYRRPDVHGGYFDADFLRQMIYRLTCLGFDDTVDAYGGIDSLSAKCREHQIKVLVAPDL